MKIKLNIILAIFILLQLSSVNAQFREWVSRYTGTYQGSIDFAWALSIDNQNNSYVTGWSSKQAGGTSAATVMYNASGVQQWASRYDETTSGNDAGYSVAADPSGQYVCVTGRKQTSSGYDYFTIKYNTSNGNIIWNKPYNGTGNGDDIANFIQLDASGNVYVTGESTGSGSNYDYVTIKYDVNGNQQWVARYNGTGNGLDNAYALSVSGGNVYVTGVSNTGSVDQIVTVAYDYLGNQLWATPYGATINTLSEQRNVIAADYTNGVYVTGLSNNQIAVIKYNPSDGSIAWAHADFAGAGRSLVIFRKGCGSILSPCHVNDIFVTGSYQSQAGRYGTMKYDEYGNFQWMQPYGNYAQPRQIAVDGYENVYVTGYINYPVSDYATVKYDKDGNQDPNWANVIYNGPGNNVDDAKGVAVNPSGNTVFVAGWSYGSGTQPDYATIKYVSMPPGGTFRFQNPNEIQSGENNMIPSSFALNQNYPNPFNPITNIKYDIPTSGYVKISVHNMLGQEISKLVNEYKDAGTYTVQFDGSRFGSGVYFYRISSGDFTDMKKMILVK